MKKLVLLGDSIRLIGYGTRLPALLRDEYEIWQPADNCRWADYTYRMPQDFYVDVLNELDEALSAKGIKTRIVFLSYLELFWTPKRKNKQSRQIYTSAVLMKDRFRHLLLSQSGIL